MDSRSNRGARGVGVLLGALAAAMLVTLALAGDSAAAPRLHPPADASASSAAAEEARIAAYWTPQRMRSTPPLDASLDAEPLAAASFVPVEDATIPPFAVNGRMFVRQGRNRGYCSGTVINSASRRLILTAGHCVHSGPRGRRAGVWSRYLLFVPAYTDGIAPYGQFVARRPEVYAPKPWVKTGNPNFDVGAFLVSRNEAGLEAADAVGGGVSIAIDRSRKEQFDSFGYPGDVRELQQCESPAVGEDRLTFPIPGPPTVKIRCRWLPGASGGGWLINEGTEVNGLTSYGRSNDKTHTFGPYFSKRNVGALVAGF